MKTDIEIARAAKPKKIDLIANQLGIMGDSKARVPRTGYLGIVSLRAGNGNNKRIFLVPAVDVKLK